MQSTKGMDVACGHKEIAQPIPKTQDMPCVEAANTGAKWRTSKDNVILSLLIILPL